MFDPRASRAVLIGTSRYTGDPGLHALPAVRNGLAALEAILLDTELCGLPRDRCVVITDPSDPREIGLALHEAGAAAEDLLLVYYAGHGLLDHRGDLYLGLTGTSARPAVLPYTAVPYGLVRESVRASRAAARVVVLDCCFSGRAIEAAAGPEAVVAGQVEIEGAYTLTSSSRTSTSVAREGSPYTAFTGELVRVLGEGVPGGPELLTLDVVYEELRRGLARAGLPEPHAGSVRSAHRLAIARNAAVARPEEEPEPAADGRRGYVPALALLAVAAALAAAVVITLLRPGGPSPAGWEAGGAPPGASPGRALPSVPAGAEPAGTAGSEPGTAPGTAGAGSPGPRGDPAGASASPGSAPSPQGNRPTGALAAQRVQVPDIRGQRLQPARNLLARMSLAEGERTEESSRKPHGVVLRTTPPAGTRVEPGTPVDLVLSRHYDDVRDLRCHTVEEVRAYAAYHGFEADLRGLDTGNEQTDVAGSQDPPAGQRLHSGETLTVTFEPSRQVTCQGPREAPAGEG
ncbi:caspase, EACC1-associated type [Bailinhaonella thermotolerans]|nr:PASTA domain-containing protein [Bailinhaonella thermotolerans]